MNVGGTVSIFLIGLAPIVLPLPVPLAPYSVISLIPAYMAGDRFAILGAALGSLVSAVAYFVFARYISLTGRTMPRASTAVFVVIAILSIVYAVFSWESAARSSLERASVVLFCALLPPCLILAAAITMRDNLSVRRSLALHWATFAWFTWSAFPWYGELI